MTFRYSKSRTPGSLVCLQHSSEPHLDTSPKSEPILELHSRAVPSAEAHHLVKGPKTGKNSGGRRIKISNHLYDEKV